MSDRSYVTLQILAVHKEQAEKLFDGENAEEEYSQDDLHCFGFSEMQGGNLDFLAELVKVGIPYDNIWDAGIEYGSGATYCRFTAEGEIVIKTIFDIELNPDIDTLLAVIDDPLALRQSILDHQEKISVLSWDNQEEYSKRFKTKQLIGI